MAKKSGKKPVNAAPSGNLKWYLGAGVLVILGSVALFLGGKVSLSKSKVEISAPEKSASASASLDVEQKAHANVDGVRAANAMGDINIGPAAAKASADKAEGKPASGKIRQEAVANAKGSQALNAGGNINLNSN